MSDAAVTRTVIASFAVELAARAVAWLLEWPATVVILAVAASVAASAAVLEISRRRAERKACLLDVLF